eukprot:4533267-Prymnesium_polylepis.1
MVVLQIAFACDRDSGVAAHEAAFTTVPQQKKHVASLRANLTELKHSVVLVVSIRCVDSQLAGRVLLHARALLEVEISSRPRKLDHRYGRRHRR